MFSDQYVLLLLVSVFIHQFTTVYYSFQVTAQQATIINTICIRLTSSWIGLIQFPSWNTSDSNKLVYRVWVRFNTQMLYL